MTHPPIEELPFKTILYDFDGVFVDTLAMTVAIHNIWRPGFTADHMRALAEGNFIVMYEKMKGSLPKKVRDDTSYYAEYEKRLPEVQPIREVFKAVSELARRFSSFVITSNHSAPVRAYLAKYGLGASIQDVLGVDVHHSKTEKIALVCERHGTTPAQCIFITDTLGDILEAHSAGAAALAVTWGHHPKETLVRGKPEGIIEQPASLVEFVERYCAI